MTSKAFDDGGIVPMKYSCFGQNVQPDFAFLDPPVGTAAYALIFHDIDVALDGGPEDGLHWVLWNIPADAGGIPEGSLPAGTVVGTNVEHKNAYLGPGAPPGPRFHHYVFEVYALSAPLTLAADASRSELLEALAGNVLGKVCYVGRFKREA